MRNCCIQCHTCWMPRDGISFEDMQARDRCRRSTETGHVDVATGTDKPGAVPTTLTAVVFFGSASNVGV